MAVTEAMKTIWMQGLLDDLGVEQDFMEVHCDDMSAIYLASNLVHHARTEHIDCSGQNLTQFKTVTHVFHLSTLCEAS